jgi:hypothetical protein
MSQLIQIFAQEYHNKTGIDRIRNEFNIVCFLFHTECDGLEYNKLINDWRTANVTAIFKKGERYKASNYRPVSLTSLCCKVQEHIIVSSILKHLDAHQILTDCQHPCVESPIP